jgi:hypothetical protein
LGAASQMFPKPSCSPVNWFEEALDCLEADDASEV